MNEILYRRPLHFWVNFALILKIRRLSKDTWESPFPKRFIADEDYLKPFIVNRLGSVLYCKAAASG